MPKLVSELDSGITAERSVDGGQLADVRTRTWRIVLNNPGESYNIEQEIGVRIGDLHPVDGKTPCVSLSERADGESRLVRVVTATYRTTPGQGGDSQSDPNSQPPDVRPARFTISSSLVEMPANRWRPLTFNDAGSVDWLGNKKPLAELGPEEEPLNPAKDRYDGVTVLVPTINVSLEQFDNNPVSALGVAGCVNNDYAEFLGLTIYPFHAMVRGITCRPTVETFGSVVYRGFVRAFEIMIFPHGLEKKSSLVQYNDDNPFTVREVNLGYVSVPGKFGFWVDQILEGFNIINDGFGSVEVDQNALNLEHDGTKVKLAGGNPVGLIPNTQGKKMRAQVAIHNLDKSWCQRPSAMPVALNTNGTPRNTNRENPPDGWERVLRQKYVTQPSIEFGKNFEKLGVRVLDII